MNHNIIIYGLLLFFVYSCNTQNKLPDFDSTDNEEHKTMAKVDSIISKSNFGIVYITKDTTAEMYDWLDITTPEKFELENFDSEYIRDIESYINIQMKHVKGINLHPYWTKLNKYNSQYYVYSPSDWMSNATMYVTDSILYRLTNPDPTISFITSFEKMSNDQYEIGIENKSGLVKKVQIECIDFEKGIYLWKFIKEDGDILHEEYKTPSNKVRNFEMIVNDCFDRKCIQEFKFD